MKIAILCPYYKIVLRGVETTVSGLKEGLIKNYGYKVDIFTLAKSSEGGVFHVAGIKRGSRLNNFLFRVFRKIKIEPLGDPGYVNHATFSLAVFIKLLRRRYDVIINYAGFWGGWACSLIRRIESTPFIINGQAGIGKPDLDNARSGPDVFIAFSPFVEKWIKGQLPDLKVETIPNFVDTAMFKAESTIDKTYDILFVGAMEPVKRPHLTIEAVAKTGLSLLMIGDGSMKGQMQEKGTKMLGDRFKLIQAPYNEMPAYYNSSRVFTLPTNEEPFGRVFLEAMACNIPVVANDYETTRWIIKNAGICCDCANIDEYANALIKAEEFNYGSRPRSRAQDFDINKILPKWKQVIKGTA